MSWTPLGAPAVEPGEAALLQRVALELRQYTDVAHQYFLKARAGRSPASELATLLGQQPIPPEIEIAEMRLFAAFEHVATLSNVLVPGVAPLLFAPFTLMRTVLEAAACAAWAWEPDLPPGEREKRGLRLRWDNLNEVVKMTNDAGAASRRDCLGVAGGPPAAVNLLSALLPEPYAGGHLGERLYRQLGGRAHAQPWTFVGAGAVIASDDRSSTVLLKPNLSHLVGALEPTLSVVHKAVDRYGELAGLNHVEWWTSRPQPPSF